MYHPGDHLRGTRRSHRQRIVIIKATANQYFVRFLDGHTIRSRTFLPRPVVERHYAKIGR